MKKKDIFVGSLGFVVFICILISIFFMGTNTYRAYAIGQEEIVFNEIGAVVKEQEINLTSDKDKSEDVIFIKGASPSSFTRQEDINNFRDINYISNANYFFSNPKHHENFKDNPDNAAGTCTTVAMQMLLGYHNYYSDRRIIPTSRGDSLQFLSGNYGNLLDDPLINSSRASGQGRASIGTEDDVYHEIFELTWISEWYGIGQAIGLVRDGASRFIDNYSGNTDISLVSEIFSKGIDKWKMA